ncbi:MAG: DUF1634 domain-containing protein [Chloroflexi bacterium]|nr:DUF1634 domain-containing protein [Chloroflexota bacterium]
MEVEKETGIPKDAPQPPLAGVVYGEIAYWILLIGMVIAAVGLIIYLVSDGYVAQDCLLDKLWDGQSAETIWEDCAGQTEIPEGHWYLEKLSKADGLAMGGIALGCLAAVVGMWGAAIAMFRDRQKLYVAFALIIAVVLTLSALGIIALEH